MGLAALPCRFRLWYIRLLRLRFRPISIPPDRAADRAVSKESRDRRQPVWKSPDCEFPRRFRPRTARGRLARSVRDARDIADELTTKGVALSLGASRYDPTDPVGRLLFNVLAMVAEFERDLISMRTKEGMAVARAKGHLKGKRPKLSHSASSCSTSRTGVSTPRPRSPSCSMCPVPPSTANCSAVAWHSSPLAKHISSEPASSAPPAAAGRGGPRPRRGPIRTVTDRDVQRSNVGGGGMGGAVGSVARSPLTMSAVDSVNSSPG